MIIESSLPVFILIQSPSLINSSPSSSSAGKGDGVWVCVHEFQSPMSEEKGLINSIEPQVKIFGSQELVWQFRSDKVMIYPFGKQTNQENKVNKAWIFFWKLALSNKNSANTPRKKTIKILPLQRKHIQSMLSIWRHYSLESGFPQVSDGPVCTVTECLVIVLFAGIMRIWQSRSNISHRTSLQVLFKLFTLLHLRCQCAPGIACFYHSHII